MNIKPLKVGNLEVRLPIIQGGMGIGVSRSNLAAAVTNAGGIGVLSGAQIGYDEEDFEENPFKANVRALTKYINEAKEKVKNGVVGINFMVAQKYYDEYVKTAINSGIDLIISGAGLPIKLPKLVEGSNVKIAPIVSSLRALQIILKSWDRKYNRTADMIIIEGPKAGGHLGFTVEDIEKGIDLDNIVVDIVNEVKKYENKYNVNLPVIVAGGIFNGYEIAKYLKMGASGVQMSTRFVTTHECDAHINFKQAYIKAKKEDINLVKSPVGLPGRAIHNNFIKKLSSQRQPIKTCYKCLSSCNPQKIPYCISQALIQAVKGNVEKGLIFCGENAYRSNKITSVKEIMNELEQEILES